MIQNKQPPPPKGPPPKPKREPRHWSQQIQETVASAIHEESLSIALKGGADSGQFVYLGSVDHDKISYHGEKLYGDDILLEVQGQKVSGYTLRDATVWLKQVSQNGAPVMIKTVRPGEWRWRSSGVRVTLDIPPLHTRPTISIGHCASRGRGRAFVYVCFYSHLSPAFLVTVWLLNSAGQGVLLDSEGMLLTLQARGIPTSCDLLILSFVFEHHTLKWIKYPQVDNSFLIPSQ